MAKNSNFSLLIVAAASFVGGAAVGLLVSPRSGRENREWLSDQATDVADWVDKKGHDALNYAENRIDSIKHNVQEELKKAVPDLYEATEDFHLNDDDVV